MSMNIDDLQKTIRLIVDRICSMDQPWAFTGSLGMAIQGLSLPVHDIDIQTNKAGAYEIQDMLSSCLVSPVRYRESDKIRSYFGLFQLDEIRIEVMGDIEKLSPDGKWIGPSELHSIIKYVNFEELTLPVLDLSYEREAYQMLGRSARVSLIDEFVGNSS